MNRQDEQKKNAALKSLDFVKSGMKLGLGTGSTIKFFLEGLSSKINNGELNNIVGVATSNETSRLAEELGIPLTSISEEPELDLAIDGADEVDECNNLIKGGGGALLREKIICQASKKFIVIVDESKLSKYLGEKFEVPVEVLPFAIIPVSRAIAKLGGKAKLRKNDALPYLTDSSNNIIDCNFGLIKKPSHLASQLKGVAGIIEHGLFVGFSDILIIAGRKGIFQRNASK